MLVGGPILIKRLLNVDFFDILVLLRPRQMTALDLNLYTHMGCRRNISIYGKASVAVGSEETENIRALDWCPGPVVFPLYLYRLISYKQHQFILQIWDILQSDFLYCPK